MPLKKTWEKLDPELKKMLLSKGIDATMLVGAVAVILVAGFTAIGAIDPVARFTEFWEQQSSKNYLQQFKDKMEALQRE